MPELHYCRLAVQRCLTRVMVDVARRVNKGPPRDRLRLQTVPCRAQITFVTNSTVNSYKTPLPFITGSFPGAMNIYRVRQQLC